MAELLRGDLGVAWVAEVAGVVVHVLAALSEGHDMVDDIGQVDNVTLKTPLT